MSDLNYEDLKSAIQIVKDGPDAAMSKAADTLQMGGNPSTVEFAATVLSVLGSNRELANMVLVAMRIGRDALEQDAERIAETRRMDLIKQVIAERFSHVPYSIVQEAMGIEDGDYASLYDSEGTGPNASRFGNEIGEEILQIAIDEIGIEAFEQRKDRIFSEGIAPRIEYKLPADPEDTDFQFLGKLTAAATGVHLSKALGIPHDIVPGAIEHDMANFFERYARSEHLFSLSHGTAPLPR